MRPGSCVAPSGSQLKPLDAPEFAGHPSPTTVTTLSLNRSYTRPARSAGRFQEILITSSFQALGLSAKLLRALAEQGFTTPTPIQTQAIPIMLAGGDLLATAQTGTGKTAGFVLPMLDRLAIAPKQKSARRRVRALVLTPTRELAAQVEESVRALGAYAGFLSSAVYGGVSMRNQIVTLQKGVDILVATPGRLLDHVQQKTVDLSSVEIFVLDEADRMLDMGFAPDVRRISNLLCRERQTAMFSATFSPETRALAHTTLRNPKQVEVGRTDRPVELVEQEAYQVPQEHKTTLLRHLIETRALHQVLIFARTRHGADRLATQLARAGIDADAIHGDKRQGQRLKTLARFKDGDLQALVATDVAARGLDISGLPAVVNYDFPGTPDAYLHRIGRTGRAGAKGCAISLVTPADRGAMADLEKHLQCRIARRTAEGLAPASGTERDTPAPARAPARRQNPRPVHQEGGRRQAGAGGRQRAAAKPRADARPAGRHLGPAEHNAPDSTRARATAPSRRPARDGKTEARPGAGQRPARARYAADAATSGERRPKRNIGNVFRGQEAGDVTSSPKASGGGKRKGIMGAIARIIGV